MDFIDNATKKKINLSCLTEMSERKFHERALKYGGKLQVNHRMQTSKKLFSQMFPFTTS